MALPTSGLPLPDGLGAETARVLLGRQRPEGGWGYNRASPADADSTAWALKFLSAADCRGSETERAEAFLGSHLRPDGGVSTYAAATRISFGGSVGRRDDSGWRGGHGCVAANAAGLIGEPAIGALRSSQGPDGAWNAYWWRGDALATALAVEAMAAGDARKRAVAWAANRARSPATAFDRAWLIRILALGGAADRAQGRALALALAAEQRPDGGWDSSAEMLFPDPAEARRHADVPIVVDDRRAFTTASALLALAGTRDEAGS
jgi:squalene-hopene/tetraprenyl-beta-curcumene cyclase